MPAACPTVTTSHCPSWASTAPLDVSSPPVTSVLPSSLGVPQCPNATRQSTAIPDLMATQVRPARACSGACTCTLVLASVSTLVPSRAVRYRRFDAPCSIPHALSFVTLLPATANWALRCHIATVVMSRVPTRWTPMRQRIRSNSMDTQVCRHVHPHLCVHVGCVHVECRHVLRGSGRLVGELRCGGELLFGGVTDEAIGGM